jgi:signal transduction histidine kinase
VTRSSGRWIVWSVGVVSVALMIAGLVFKFVDRGTTLPEVSDAWSLPSVLDAVANIGVPLLAMVIASRRPGNPIGWLFLSAGVALGLQAFGRPYGLHALVVDPGSLPGGRAMAWASNWTGAFAVSLVPFLFLLFPDGRPASPRWKPVAWLAGALLVALTTSTLVIATIEWRDPFADSLPEHSWIGSIAVAMLVGSFFLAPVVIGLTFASVVARHRHARGDERLLLKWFSVASALVAGTLTVTILTNAVLAQLLFTLSLLLLYASIGLAIVKYRLYDIDALIAKAVLYGVLGSFITAVYVVVVVVIGAAVGATEGLALVATAIVSVAFLPVRERARRAANRFVYGERATPHEVLSGFAQHVARTYEGEDVLPRMARLLAEGTGASSTTVWLRVGSEIRPAASWPTQSDGESPRALVKGSLPPFDGVAAAVQVDRHGELLGALTITKPPTEPSLLPAEERLVADVAASAGLVFENFRLIEDLRSSRQRLVAAQDEERRRLERDIHDGAQQQLVALSVKVRLVEDLVGRDDQRARDALHAILTDTQDALDTLRDLAHGIYPPLLADQGLRAALEAQARKTTLPVTVEADGAGRFPAEVEAAVYFCVLEALQNVAKYAQASSVRVIVRRWDGDLEFAVIDDGSGFDRDATPLGMGLLNMADRLAAVGGELEVKTRPGHGTNVSGRIPIP